MTASNVLRMKSFTSRLLGHERPAASSLLWVSLIRKTRRTFSLLVRLFRGGRMSPYPILCGNKPCTFTRVFQGATLRLDAGRHALQTPLAELPLLRGRGTTIPTERPSPLPIYSGL